MPRLTFGQDAGRALRRFWWLVVLGFVIGLVVGFVIVPEPEYSTQFRATVLIPGDTEDTGSAERPELMVLDDLGPFIESWVFAEAVAGEMEGQVATEDVYGMLDGSRYSRIATVELTGEDRTFVEAAASAAAEVFPEEVNAYLVAPFDPDATIRVIDPPRDATQDHTMRWLRTGAIALLGTASAAGLAILISPDTRRNGRAGA